MRKNKNGLPVLAQTRQSAKRMYKKLHEAYKKSARLTLDEIAKQEAEAKAETEKSAKNESANNSTKSDSAKNASTKKNALEDTKKNHADIFSKNGILLGASPVEQIPYHEAAGLCEKIKALLQGDLFYLLVYGMNRKDMDNDWLFDRCREVQQNPNDHLDLWAREHYKSTIITIGLTIQNILNDPNITVGIFSHTRPIAKAFLRQIKREWETNTLLQAYFPHIASPEKAEARTRTWSEDGGLIVKRDGNPKEATLEAWGLVDGQPTGKHFALLIYDDVVTLESVSTPEQIKKTTDAWRLSLNLGARDGHLRMIGTRYHASDTYHLIMEQGSVIPRVYPATDDGLSMGKAIFLDDKSLAKKRRDMGPYVFACQMLQNPLADNAMGFKKEWFQTLPSTNFESIIDTQNTNKSKYLGEGMNRYIVVDPASSKKEGSDYTSMWVVGLNHDGFYYIIDGVHDRLALHERAEALFSLHKKHKPLGVGYEQYGIQADIEHIKYRMEHENYRFSITALGGAMAKTDRIRRLVPVFEQGRLWFPHKLVHVRVDRSAVDLVQEFYKKEYLNFPVAGHDDMLDCLSRILDSKLGAVFPMSMERENTLSSQNFFS